MFFDLILAWHSDILKCCPHAVKVEYGTCSSELSPKKGGFKKKVEDEISFITSNKAFTEGHHLRQRIFDLFQTTVFNPFINTAPSINGFRIKSRRTPPRIQSVEEVYINAKFNICVP